MTATTDPRVTAPAGNLFTAPTLYKNKAHIAEDTEPDKEPVTDPKAAVEGSSAEPGTTPEDDRPEENPEEKTFKKRYGDLRRYSQQVTNKKDEEIAALKRQLTEVARKDIQLPKSPEEIARFKSEFPDVFDTIKTVVLSEVDDRQKYVEEQLKAVHKRQADVARKEAERELARMHPDIEELKASEEFHSWAAEQPKWVQEALYDNPDDPFSCGRAIDLYKADKGIAKVKKAKGNDTKENSKVVLPTAAKEAPNTNSGGKKVWSLSAINKMTPREYERNEAEIDAAMQEGRISA